MLTLAHVLRTLKHHVLEKVSKTCVAGQLVPRADVKCYAERHSWRSVIFREHDAQAVLQSKLLYRDLYAASGRRICRFLSCLCGFCRTTGYKPQRQNKSKGATDIEKPHFVLLPKNRTLLLYPNSYWTAGGGNS